MNLKDFPYKTSFSAEIKCLVAPETDKFLSLASLDSLKFLIPQNFIDAQGIDLLPIAFNACVVNRANKNGDSINTATALNICKNFIHRPTDIDHKVQEVCGHIINAGYTQFGSDKELTEDQVKDMTDPFNMALAAYIYARNFDDLAEMIEEAADPDSLKFKTISASWELLFKDYKIVQGTKNLSEAKVIEDPDEIKRLKPFLQVNKGSGKDKSGNFIYRLITGEVYTGGIGLTKQPAAEVKGIFVPGITDKDLEENTANENNLIKNKEIISKIEKPDVNKTEYMKLSTLEDVKGLTDEKLKEAVASEKSSVASQINNVLEIELAKISEKVTAEKLAKDTAIANAGEISKELEKVKADLELVKANQLAKNAEVAFNTRMTSLDETYKLEDAHRKIIAKQIKDLDEPSFIVWSSDFEVMNAGMKKSKSDETDDESAAAKKKIADDEATATKDKKDKEDKDKADKDKIDKDKADKGKDKSMASDAQTLLDAIKVTVASVIPNTVSTNESLVEKYKTAFAA